MRTCVLIRYYLLKIVCILITIQSYADISLPYFFSDHMVLQQNQDIVVFGKAEPKESITASFKNEILKTIAKSDGTWSIVFKSSSAGGPFQMTLKGRNTIVFDDIYIGEVWFCSGQSNMGWTIEKSENGLEELNKANYEQIKLLNVRRSMSSSPLSDIDSKNKWETCTPKNSKRFSAVAYYFGTALYQKLKVPIGLIHSSWGGSNIEAWMNSDTFKEDKGKQELLQSIKSLDLNQLAEDYKIVEKEYKTFLDEIDRGTKENWLQLSTDYTDWKTFSLPVTWSRTEIEKRYGVVWVTKAIKLSEAEIKDEVKLSLGRIDNEDITYFNGERVGALTKNDILRSYTVPKRLLKIGENRITIRVKNPLDIGGFRGSAKDLYIDFETHKKSLATIWRYKVGTPNVKAPPERVHPKYLPSSLYNAMLHPFFQYNIKGIIWYQGESNMGRAEEYAKLFPDMILDWRKQWQKEIPFLFVQLPNLANKNNRLPKFREAQKRALQLNNVGMVTTIDIGDDYNIHPKNKKDVGNRLAIVAEDLVYGKNSNGHDVKIKSILLEQNTITIVFEDDINIKGNVSEIVGFEVSNNGKVFTPVSAKQIDSRNIQIEHSEVKEAKYIRYLWKDAPGKVMIYSTRDFPLVPFQYTLK